MDTQNFAFAFPSQNTAINNEDLVELISIQAAAIVVATHVEKLTTSLTEAELRSLVKSVREGFRGKND
jgi:hypothetical protein